MPDVNRKFDLLSLNHLTQVILQFIEGVHMAVDACLNHEDVPSRGREDGIGDFPDLGIGQSLLELGRQVLKTEGPQNTVVGRGHRIGAHFGRNRTK